MQHGGRTRGRAAKQVDAWDLWAPGTDPGAADGQSVTGICARVAELVSAALWTEDAGAAWERASRLLEDPSTAIEVLGSTASDPEARHALIQRLGGVGGLIVVACEELLPDPRHSRGKNELGDSDVGAGAEVHELLRGLLIGFASLPAEALDDLVGAIERADGFDPGQELARARRWLNVTYAVAARDGTEEAHQLYFLALDRVLESTRSLVTS